jgi:uncharacterized membrane protein affecting hemolysin expression/class 3 adenylate cyclase
LLQNQFNGAAYVENIRLQTSHKLALSFAILFIVVTSAFWLLFQNELNRSLREYSDILGASLAEQTATSVRELVLVNDPLGLNVVLTQLVRDSNIVYAVVYDVDGRQLASAGQASINTANATIIPAQQGFYSADITVQDAIAGSIQLELDSMAVAGFQSRMRNLFLLVLTISLILVVSTAFALAGAITNPILATINTIIRKTGDDEFNESEPSETQRLQFAVENLLAKFQDMEEKLLETGVWEKADEESDSVPVKVNATMLVINVVNINTAIELLHPPTLANLLREYIFYLKQAASLFGGSFQRQSGDSILISFDSIDCKDRHSINALQCAGLFQLIMNRINLRHKEKGEQILEFRMAIHSGDIFLAPGLFSDNVKECGMLGKTIDIAYFLCTQSAPNQLIISDSACSQAMQFEQFETAGQNEISMPADNVSFMAYILSNNFAGEKELIRKKCDHILDITKITDQTH